MTKDASAVAETGSHPSGQAPMGLVAPRFDPARNSEWVTPEFRDAERKILIAMYDGVDPDFGYFPFKSIARASGVQPELVKPLVRIMQQLGDAMFMRGLMNEDGEVVGSGYGLTEKGRVRAHGYYVEQLDRDLKASAIEARRTETWNRLRS